MLTNTMRGTPNKALYQQSWKLDGEVLLVQNPSIYTDHCSFDNNLKSKGIIYLEFELIYIQLTPCFMVYLGVQRFYLCMKYGAFNKKIV